MTGTGTAADPYIIESVTDLQNIENDLTAYYELGGNIDASATSTWNANAGFIPITEFTGELDGKDYYIDQLFIDRLATAYQGLFGKITGGTVKNLGMTTCDITGLSTGSIASQNNGTITNCYSTGAVSGRYVGGFVSENESGATITLCYTTCDVEGNNSGSTAWAGGFIQDNDGTIENCYARGALSTNATTSHLDGFVQTGSGTETNCYSTGAVPDVAFDNGFGSGQPTINCFWDTETSGRSNSDTGTGKTTAQMKSRSTFTEGGWDFDTIWFIASSVNNGYPSLGEVEGDEGAGILAVVEERLHYVDAYGTERYFKGTAVG